MQQPVQARDQEPSNKRLFFLDFIRALSVLMIILYHFDIQLLGQSSAAHTIPGFVWFHQAVGDLGVTLFIMISGVALMTSTSSRFSAIEFYKKRFLAIFPSYWIAYAAAGCALFLIRGFWTGDDQHWKIILTIAGLDGLTLYREPNYYLIGEWFIGFILCMYAMFPILRRGVIERPIMTWVSSLVLFCVLHRYYDQLFVLNENRNPLVRLPEFLFGLCFLRYVMPLRRYAFCISVIALVLFLFWMPPVPMQLYGILLGMAVFCAMSFVAEKFPFPTIIGRYVEAVARYSFLAFLVHHQIIYILLPRFNASALTPVEVYVLFALVVVLSFSAAKVLYKPVDRLTNLLRRIVFVRDDAPAIARAMTALSGWTGLLGIAVFASSIFGVVHFYSPVPLWDEWDGYIGFYRDITSGSLGGWWVNHMEHRSVTSSILYWLDVNVFGGVHLLLFAAELTLVAITVLVIWREYARGRSTRAPEAWVGGLSLALLFSWLQQEVFKWGFETQVLAAYMFAVLAAAQFSRFEDPRGKRIFGALVFASLAQISMGNGLMTFPMLFALGIVCRRPLRELAAVVVTWIVMWAIYFFDYSLPTQNDPAFTAVKLAKTFVAFFFVFLGNPLATLTNNNILVCIAAGASTFALACGIVFKLYRSKSIASYRAFLIGGYGFVVLSALAAMSGRAFYGPEAAMPSRYTTGPLLAWVLLALLAFDVARMRSTKLATLTVSATIATIIVPSQWHVADDNAYLYDQKLAILAHKIGADRPGLDALLYPAPAHDHFSDLATFAESSHVALYGKGWIKDAGEVRYDASKRDDSTCRGYFDWTGTDKLGPVLKGWATTNPVSSDELLIVIADKSGKTIGYGVTGLPRLDVTATAPGNPRNSGWTAFATQPVVSASAYAYVSGKFCRLTEP
ncbi:acyltransferase family protein [Paraburkholderia sacchari]|uniref:acyltransferase family protein n=1 Tax=Paraburkholderia sacchari TaxID=159450 RepID=UPI001BCB6B92|nr:acyltransferase [Paraburkholderia sacchari]